MGCQPYHGSCVRTPGVQPFREDLCRPYSWWLQYPSLKAQVQWCPEVRYSWGRQEDLHGFYEALVGPL